MINTTVWPASWKARSFIRTTQWPRWMSGLVGSTPNLTRSGRPSASCCCETALGQRVDGPVQEPSRVVGNCRIHHRANARLTRSLGGIRRPPCFPWVIVPSGGIRRSRPTPPSLRTWSRLQRDRMPPRIRLPRRRSRDGRPARCSNVRGRPAAARQRQRRIERLGPASRARLRCPGAHRLRAARGTGPSSRSCASRSSSSGCPCSPSSPGSSGS